MEEQKLKKISITPRVNGFSMSVSYEKGEGENQTDEYVFNRGTDLFESLGKIVMEHEDQVSEKELLKENIGHKSDL